MTPTPENITVSIDGIAAIFTEWQRQWQEDPEGFLSAEEHFGETPDEYGPAAAQTFERIRLELIAAEGITS